MPSDAASDAASNAANATDSVLDSAHIRITAALLQPDSVTRKVNLSINHT